MTEKGLPLRFKVEIQRNQEKKTHYIELTLLPHDLHFIVKGDISRTYSGKYSEWKTMVKDTKRYIYRNQWA